MSVIISINENKINSPYVMYDKTLRNDIKLSRNKKIGSYIRRGTQDPGRGLSSDQEAYFLSSKLGVRPDSPEYDSTLRTFWQDYGVDKDLIGAELNVNYEIKTVSLKNKEKVEIEVPENLEHYMAYRFAVGHPHVASSADQLSNKDTFDFVIIDNEKEKINKRDLFEVKQKALKHVVSFFADIHSKPEMADHIVYLMKNPDEIVEGLSLIEKQMYISECAEKNPAKLLEVFETQDLEYKALVVKAVEFGALVKEGNTYFFGDKALGDTQDSVARYLKNPNNARELMTIRQRVDTTTVSKKVVEKPKTSKSTTAENSAMDEASDYPFDDSKSGKK